MKDAFGVDRADLVSKKVGLNNPLIRSKEERKAARGGAKNMAMDIGQAGVGGGMLGGGAANVLLSPSAKGKAIGAGIAALGAGIGAGPTVRQNKRANAWRKQQGLKPRNFLGVPKKD